MTNYAILILLLGAAACTSVDEERERARAVSEGKALYKSYGCGVCHGAEGRGDGPVAKNLNPKPRDFRDPTAYSRGRSLGAIAETVKVGVVGKGTGMPGYPHIPETDRRMIAAYVASFQGSE